MTLSVFDIFKVGIGPSSSHTVGPMWAGHRFIQELRDKGIINSVASVRVGLYGSLALTGIGHGTDKACILGLAGRRPDTIDPDEADEIFERVKEQGILHFAGERDVPFDYDTQMVFHMGESLPEHPNGMRIFASDASGIVVTIALPAGFSYVSDDGGGSYLAASGLWTLGVLAAGGNATLAITATVNASGPYATVAEITAAAAAELGVPVGVVVAAAIADARSSPRPMHEATWKESEFSA